MSQGEAGWPDLRVITVVFDQDTQTVEVEYNAENMSGFEAWGLLLAAAEQVHDVLFMDDDIDDEDDQ